MALTAAASKPLVLCLKGDDRKLNLKRLKGNVKDAEIACAADMVSGLEFLSQRQVALFILDPDMGKTDGVEYLGRARKLSPDTLIVLMNCSHNPALIVKAIDTAKAWKCLTSPWKPEEMDQTVSNALDYWKRRQKQKERPVIERPDFYMQLVRQLTDLLNQSEKLDVILQETVTIISSSLNYDAVSICLWNDEKRRLIVRAAVGLNLGKRSNIELKSNEGLTGFVFKSRRSLTAMPASKHAFFKRIPELHDEDMESYIGVPILMGNQCFGVLVAQKMEKKLISSAEEMMFQLITSRMAGMLDVTGRVEKLRKSKTLKHAARVYQGKGVSTGYATGPVFLLQGLFKEVSLDHLEPASLEKEVQRLKQAFKNVEKDQKALIQELIQQGDLSKSEIKIFKSHLMIVQDSHVQNEICDKINQGPLTAEQAVVSEFESFAARFENQKDRYFQERAQDFRDIGEKILQFLLESRGELKKSRKSLKGAVIVARDINPSLLPTLNKENAAAIVTETGGATSHAAILAKSLGIPAVSGVENVCEHVNRGEVLLVDGKTGLVFLNPDKSLLEEYVRNSRKQTQLQKSIEKEGLVQKKTSIPANLCASVGFPVDVDYAVKYKIRDVGLFRTEFPFMQYNQWPSVNEQHRIYTNMARNFPGEVTIRTLDVGADKLLPYFKFPQEENPMLGLRSIRFSMEYLDYFKDQIKAILMAVKDGYRLRILLPMISQLWELETASEIIMQLGAEMRIAKTKLPQIGIMTEVPGVLQQLNDFEPYINFISVGTNDLVQYMLAVDRNSTVVGHLYSEFHPAVIRTLHEINNIGRELKLEVSVCGEMAGTAAGALALLSLGCYNLSILPSRVPLIRFLINNLSASMLGGIRQTILKATRKKEIERFLQEALESLDPRLLETD